VNKDEQRQESPPHPKNWLWRSDVGGMARPLERSGWRVGGMTRSGIGWLRDTDLNSALSLSTVGGQDWQGNQVGDEVADSR
jgi:hypothetical protein